MLALLLPTAPLHFNGLRFKIWFGASGLPHFQVGRGEADCLVDNLLHLDSSMLIYLLKAVLMTGFGFCEL